MLSTNTRDLDYGRLVLASRKIKGDPSKPLKRIALIGDAATQLFVPLLRVLFHDNGFNTEFYEGHFDAVDLDVVNSQSDLFQFQPDFVFIVNCTQSLRSKYFGRRGSGEEFAADTLARMTDAWESIHRNSSAIILQCNFVTPYERLFGNYDQSVPRSLSAVVQLLNQGLAERARERNYVFLADVAAVASTVGTRTWFDERHWASSKTMCAPEYLPLLAQNFVEMALTHLGRAIKCIVLDLDNTLWGGVVGDDGPDGIQINAHGEGESYYHFQCYLRELKRRGIILAVCSKNDASVAILPFRENPEMALKEEDISVFVANWGNKADNIRKIRETLDIGLDSMVFLDDNPFERNLVREFVPEILVPEMPEDPADYVRAVTDLNLFEANSFSTEDTMRADQYRQEALRRTTAEQFTNIEDYLQSLEMTIEVARFDAFHLSRIAQLIQRSNQFNLTTRRHTQVDCENMAANHADVLPLYARLSDRFGDHGLISVVIARQEGSDFVISDWLMSCRVLARGVEQYLMNLVFDEAVRRGCRRVVGEYIPSAKNKMVRDFFRQFGFEKIEESASGHTVWALACASYEQKPVFIRSAELVAV